MSSESSNQFFALVDCNHFYVSCERVFRPDLENKPVGILSNNDGCIVALSPEMKKLGIKRGVPYFKIKPLIQKHQITIFSSNYSLYGDMSFRVMRTLSHFSPDMEIYSIDEAFLSLSGHLALDDYGKNIRNTVRKWTGIPVSVGIAPTKTLAKLANHWAKKSGSGVLCLCDKNLQEKILIATELGDIWGIGFRNAAMLKKNGINNALELTKLPKQWLLDKMSVVGLRTVEELKGKPCLELDMIVEPKKQIITSRSFGKPVRDLVELQEALSSYCTTATEKLRYQNSLARRLTVFITTNPFKNEPQYANYREIILPSYTAYTPDFIKAGTKILNSIYRKDYQYKKVGIVLTDIIQEEEAPLELYESSYIDDNRSVIAECVDNINNKWGRNTVGYASSGIQKKWQMRRAMVSPRFTTSWNELLRVKA